jgi:pyridoxal phosphate enzyme (YggS family)
MTAAVAGSVAERLAAVREQIAGACRAAGRSPSEITLVGVSKTFPAEAVAEAVRAGLADLGENRVQEGVPKAEALAEMGLTPTWHLVGHLQTNKVRKALEHFHVFHSVDSERLVAAIGKAATHPIRVFLQVNVAGEDTKSGVAPSDLARLVDAARNTPNVEVQGLMTIAPIVQDPEEARPVFAELRRLAERHGLTQLSMGMSHDFAAAIAEGATHVRIGRAIFGERA